MTTFAPGELLSTDVPRDAARQLHDTYVHATPFPHIVIDDFTDTALLDRVISEFPSSDDMGIQFDAPQEVKSAEQSWARMGPATRELLTMTSCAPFLAMLEDLTGIQALIPDPLFEGGGLHQIRRGGKLGVHADFNKHLIYGLDRRLNLLLYLNRDWDDAWGGQLELWDRDMTTCVRRVAPVFNRCVVFSTTSHAFHGHPDPLQCPPEVTRKSVALYYYTNGRPADEEYGHHNTLFQRRPGTNDVTKPKRNVRDRVKLLVPPILLPESKRL
ncbi:MAG: hypothetical protein QOI55_311 [Actinomycetota bacterium]|nr:hypothetical protein [Actinomycetota bacterium]